MTPGHKYCAEPSRLVAFANAVLCNQRFKDEVAGTTMKTLELAIQICVNYNDLTATSLLGIMAFIGKLFPNGLNSGELLQFTQIHMVRTR